MIFRILALPVIIISSMLLTSCETTSGTGYGYYLGELTDDTIVELFALSDAAAQRQDFEFYKSFFSPNYSSVDRTDSNRSILYREGYLDMVEDIFKTAESVHLQTLVMDIEYSNGGHNAFVKVHEEEKIEQYGQTRHYTSLLDVELEIEEGWVFVNKTTRTSTQVIEE
ncbi:nuclear transport factor 2 family protein [Pelagicoccus sp. SDUM812002]|uniref:nuclear transport factor 2 family protein n=1 Tax=Pelagicoccus sp. SDUM812002 TaxID=3041266 RepID=UPI00280C78BB|nr:nuclear transport factor 2 family protein [Pelagicoccus sp. SDUM812002]MDQ8184047.1 nuclear transport factor 2 family protein [Pelagicoccus sp. SDUM812002]